MKVLWSHFLKITSSDYTYIIGIMGNCPAVIHLLIPGSLVALEGREEGGANSIDMQIYALHILMTANIWQSQAMAYCFEVFSALMYVSDFHIFPHAKKKKKRNEKHIEKPNKFPFYDNDLHIRSTRTSGKSKCD